MYLCWLSYTLNADLSLFYKQMHIFSFRVEKIAPACTERYIIEVSEIVFLYDTHDTLGKATAVFQKFLLSMCIQ